MLELLQNFEQATGRFSPTLLIVPGVIILLAGLFIWLGGLGLGRLLGAVTGAATGAICGFFVIRRTVLSAAFLATVLAAAAVIFEKAFFIILTTAMAAVLTFAVFARPYLGNPRLLSATNRTKVAVQKPTLSPRETAEVVKAYVVNAGRELKQVCSKMPFYSWVVIPAVTAIFFFVGLKSWRFVSAISCATLGAVLIFAGMILLLLYKGSAPVSGIYRKVPLYCGAFIVMVAFGAIEQLLLCRREIKKQQIKKKKKAINLDELEPPAAGQGWRSA
jgi:hypothetical protein